MPKRQSLVEARGGVRAHVDRGTPQIRQQTLSKPRIENRWNHHQEGKAPLMAEYAHPDVLVPTDWVAQQLDDSNVKLVEVDVDTEAYDQGHIKGAIGWSWTSQHDW